MKKPEPHPRLKMLHDRFGKNRTAITLSGFVGPSEEGFVRLFPTPNARDCIEIPKSAIVYFEQSDALGSTEIFIDPSATVTVISTRKIPIVAIALRPRNGGHSDGGTEKTCLEKRIEKCKSDPMVHDKSFCDSEKGKETFQLLCDLLGDPKLSGIGSGHIIV